MSVGVVLDRDAAVRTREVVREVEAARATQGSEPPGVKGIKVVRITEEVGDGEYKVDAVRREAGAWVIAGNNPFNDGDINIYELNGATGIAVGTVVKVEFLRDVDDGSTFWSFGATGAGEYDGPFAIQRVNATVVKFFATSSAVQPDIISVGEFFLLQSAQFNHSVSLPVSGTETWYAWLKVSQFTSGGSAGTPIQNRELTNTLPTFSNEYHTILLATIEVVPSGISSIRQDQRAHINIPATIVEYTTSSPFKLTSRVQTNYVTDIVEFEECVP